MSNSRIWDLNVNYKDGSSIYYREQGCLRANLKIIHQDGSLIGALNSTYGTIQLESIQLTRSKLSFIAPPSPLKPTPSYYRGRIKNNRISGSIRASRFSQAYATFEGHEVQPSASGFPNNTSKNVIFIISPPRSGSTLTARLLDSHPAIFSAPELHLIHPLAYLGYFNVKSEWQSLSGVNSTDMKLFQDLSKLGIKSVVNWLPNGEEDYFSALRAYTDAIYSKLLNRSGKEYIVDKSPPYCAYYQLVTGIYPQANYIVLTRNPIHTGFSLRKWIIDTHAAGESKEFTFNHLDMAKVNQSTLKQMGMYLRGTVNYLRSKSINFYQVRFEDLVSNTEQECRNICQFLNIEYDDVMLSYDPAGSIMPGNPGDVYTTPHFTAPDSGKLKPLPDDIEDNIELAIDLVNILSKEDLAQYGYSKDQLLSLIEEHRTGLITS